MRRGGGGYHDLRNWDRRSLRIGRRVPHVGELKFSESGRAGEIVGKLGKLLIFGNFFENGLKHIAGGGSHRREVVDF